MKKIKVFLQTIAVLHIAGGVLLPWIVELPWFASYFQHLAEAFNTGSVQVTAETKFLVGILGPTIASWGVLFFYIINSSFANPTPQIWWGIIIASLVWAPYDSLISMSHGVYFNVFLNVIVFFSIIIPMIIVKPEFFDQQHN